MFINNPFTVDQSTGKYVQGIDFQKPKNTWRQTILIGKHCRKHFLRFKKNLQCQNSTEIRSLNNKSFRGLASKERKHRNNNLSINKIT